MYGLVGSRLNRIKVSLRFGCGGSPLPNTHRNETGVGGALSLYVDKMTDTKLVFNGDTAGHARGRPIGTEKKSTFFSVARNFVCTPDPVFPDQKLLKRRR